MSLDTKIEFKALDRPQYAYPKDKSTPIDLWIFVNGVRVGFVWHHSEEGSADEYVCWWDLNVRARMQDMKHGGSGYATLLSAKDAARKRIRRQLNDAYELARRRW